MKRLLLTMLCIVAIVISCDKANPVCEEIRKTATLAIDFPDSVQAGVNFRLHVNYIIDNSCGNFDNYEVIQTDNSTQITMYAKYEGCNCALQFEERASEFDIMIGQPGMYDYQFWVADNEWDTYSLKVYQ